MSKFTFCPKCLDIRQFFDHAVKGKNQIVFECDICGCEI